MNKYDITILIPSINKKYELFVPNNILIGNLLYMFIESIKELDNINIENMNLFLKNEGSLLETDKYVYESIKNGENLLLM